jgi:hypothetical protein
LDQFRPKSTDKTEFGPIYLCIYDNSGP